MNIVTAFLPFVLSMLIHATDMVMLVQDVSPNHISMVERERLLMGLLQIRDLQLSNQGMWY